MVMGKEWRASSVLERNLSHFGDNHRSLDGSKHVVDRVSSTTSGIHNCVSCGHQIDPAEQAEIDHERAILRLTVIGMGIVLFTAFIIFGVMLLR